MNPYGDCCSCPGSGTISSASVSQSRSLQLWIGLPRTEPSLSCAWFCFAGPFNVDPDDAGVLCLRILLLGGLDNKKPRPCNKGAFV